MPPLRLSTSRFGNAHVEGTVHHPSAAPRADPQPRDDADAREPEEAAPQPREERPQDAREAEADEALPRAIEVARDDRVQSRAAKVRHRDVAQGRQHEEDACARHDRPVRRDQRRQLRPLGALRPLGGDRRRRRLLLLLLLKLGRRGLARSRDDDRLASRNGRASRRAPRPQPTPTRRREAPGRRDHEGRRNHETHRSGRRGRRRARRSRRRARGPPHLGAAGKEYFAAGGLAARGGPGGKSGGRAAAGLITCRGDCGMRRRTRAPSRGPWEGVAPRGVRASTSRITRLHLLRSTTCRGRSRPS